MLEKPKSMSLRNCLIFRWIEACIGEEIGEITKMDDLLRYGVILAKLAKFFEPSVVKKIFEVLFRMVYMLGPKVTVSSF
jgi:hypothetical protein